MNASYVGWFLFSLTGVIYFYFAIDFQNPDDLDIEAMFTLAASVIVMIYSFFAMFLKRK